VSEQPQTGNRLLTPSEACEISPEDRKAYSEARRRKRDWVRACRSSPKSGAVDGPSGEGFAYRAWRAYSCDNQIVIGTPYAVSEPVIRRNWRHFRHEQRVRVGTGAVMALTALDEGGWLK
jgi:hypothetical protein